MHKTAELRADIVIIMTFLFYMTDFMFVFNALLLGNSGFASENNI